MTFAIVVVPSHQVLTTGRPPGRSGLIGPRSENSDPQPDDTVVVHLLFGAAGLALARTVSGARTYLVGGGAVYLVLWLYGLVVGQNSSANFVPLNPADDWLHLGLGLGMIALGLLLTRRTAR